MATFGLPFLWPIFIPLMNAPHRHIPFSSDAFSSYWKGEDGFLSQCLPPDTSLAEAQDRVPLYFTVDTVGDAFVQEFFLPHGFQAGMQKLHELLQNYPNGLDKESENTRTFLNQLFIKPAWLEEDLLDKGARFCNRTGTSGLATLRNYCLMGGYESSAINKPLIFTGALKKGAVKRLSDTVVFWINVTEPQGMQVMNQGFISAVTTRAIHSYSRLMIEKTPEWRSELWGRPLNMWDMLATNLGFSIAFLDGLVKLGFTPKESEILGVLHLWKYVGYLLGIPEALLPHTKEKAAQELFYWSRTQKGADQDSAALAFSLYEEPMKVTFTNSSRMKKFVRNTNLGYNYFMLGNETTSALKLPKARMLSWIQMITRINQLNEKVTKLFPMLYSFYVKKGRKQQLNVLRLYRKV